MEKRNRAGIVILTMFIVILVLVGVIAYSFWIQPAIKNYSDKKMMEGYQIAFTQIVTQIQNTGSFSIPIDDQGNTIVLVRAK